MSAIIQPNQFLKLTGRAVSNFTGLPDRARRLFEAGGGGGGGVKPPRGGGGRGGWGGGNGGGGNGAGGPGYPGFGSGDLIYLSLACEDAYKRRARVVNKIENDRE